MSNSLKTLKMEVMGNRACSSLFTKINPSFAVALENTCAVSDDGDICGEGDKGTGLVIPESGSRCVEMMLYLWINAAVFLSGPRS